MMTSLLNHLWQSTLFAAVVWGLSFLVRRHRADLRHTLWLVASLKFLVPFRALVAAGGLVPLAKNPIDLNDVLTLSSVAQQFSIEPLEPGLFFLRARAAAAAAPEASVAGWPLMMLAGIWAAGALTVTVRWAVQGWRVERLLRQAVPLSEGREIEALRTVEIACRSLRRHALLAGDASLEPGVVGIVRPVLFWPRGLSGRLSDAQIEAILSHELAHVARHDNAKALAHMVVQALFWFHPAVWWIGARLIDERERACDEHVVRQGREREVYAQSILATCTFVIEAPLPCVSGVTGADLKMRIEAIMRGQPGRALTLVQRLAIALVAIAVVTTPLVAGALTTPRKAAKRFALVKAHGEPVAFMPITLSQHATERRAFEVASVRENVSGDGPVRIEMQPGGRVTAVNFPLSGLVRLAYQLQNDQIVGIPGTLADRRFDIVAKAPGNVMPSSPGAIGTVQLMLQSLMAERFGLRVHRETRDLPAFALVRAHRDGHLGPQLSLSNVDCDALIRSARASGQRAPPPGQGGRPTCGMNVRPGRMVAGGFPVSELARTLSDLLKRTVIDQTMLTGNYDMEVTFTPERVPSLPPGGPEPWVDPNAPALATALQEQLGLKLDAIRAPVDVLVVDQITMPTPD